MNIKLNNDQLNRVIQDIASRILDLDINSLGKTAYLSEMNKQSELLVKYLQDNNLKRLEAGIIEPVLRLMKKDRMSYKNMEGIVAAMANKPQMWDDTGTVESLLEKNFFDPIFGDGTVLTLIDYTSIQKKNGANAHALSCGNSLFLVFMQKLQDKGSHLEQYALKYLSKQKNDRNYDYEFFIELLDRVGKDRFNKKDMGNNIDKKVAQYEEEFLNLI